MLWQPSSWNSSLPKALMILDEPIVSQAEGTAVVKLNAPADLAALKKAVTEQGYQVKK